MSFKNAEKKPLKADKIRELNVDDLEQELGKLEEARFRLSFRSATEPVEQSSQFRVLRRNIARVKTVLREKRTKA